MNCEKCQDTGKILSPFPPHEEVDCPFCTPVVPDPKQVAELALIMNQGMNPIPNRPVLVGAEKAPQPPENLRAITTIVTLTGNRGWLHTIPLPVSDALLIGHPILDILTDHTHAGKYTPEQLSRLICERKFELDALFVMADLLKRHVNGS